jgi:hypothetical protein
MIGATAHERLVVGEQEAHQANQSQWQPCAGGKSTVAAAAASSWRRTVDPLPHPDQAVAVAVAVAFTVRAAGSVVLHLELAGRTLVTDDHFRASGAGVLERVCQCLLHDPEGGEIQWRRQRRRRSLDAHLDR